MSDHEDTGSEMGYKSLLHELDDHRHPGQSAPAVAVRSPEQPRPRRGTVDTLYGSRQHIEREFSAQSPEIIVRDFEEAIADGEDDTHLSPGAHARRPTFASEHRDVSPPNSVKAFAEARRRERAFSVVDKDTSDDEDRGLHRTHSSQSRNSHRTGRSRPATYKTNDAASIATGKTAEEDVCFPQEDRGRDRLYIDFDYLETFIAAEASARRASLDARRAQKEDRVFSARPPSAVPAAPMFTSDGDFISGAHSVSDLDEKPAKQDPEVASAIFKEQDPNRFSFFSSAWESTIHASELGDLILPGEELRGLFSFPANEPDGVWWLNVNSPTEEEIRIICRAFGVHPLTIEDITNEEPREKIELFPSYYFASFRSFSMVHDPDGTLDYDPFNIYVLVFREGTLSFSFHPNAHASHVRKRITMLKDYVSLSSDWISYALIDDVVDSFAKPIEKIEIETEGIEDSVFVARPEDMHQFLRRIGAVRKNVLGLMRVLGGKADVLKGFTKRCNENYKVTPRMDIGMYLGDIQDHVVTMMTNLMHFEKILSRSHANYLAQLTIDSISEGTKTNAGLTKITFLASIIVPLNVVTGLFGMNVRVPFQDEASIIPWVTILAGLISFCIIALMIARRLKLL
ncbi:magnesium transporter [Microdochium nivale]|nr:magnesium transporter [Microdochium nivale]